MELQVESRGTLNRRPQQASLVFEPLPQGEHGIIERRCQKHPDRTLYQRLAESCPRCELGHPAERWDIVHVRTGRIIGTAHYMNGGTLRAGVVEGEGVTEPQKCRRGHVGQLRPDGRCLECRRQWDARKKES